MKIAISGSAGIGKTTLAKALATRLGVDFIAEGYEPMFDRPGRFHGDFAGLTQVIRQILETKHTLEQRAGSFVADRCPADLMRLWLARETEAPLLADLRAFEARCRLYMADYDAVVIPPFDVFKLEQQNIGATGFRVLDYWSQLRSYAGISGLVMHFAGSGRVITIPDSVPPGGWVDFIIDHLRHRSIN